MQALRPQSFTTRTATGLPLVLALMACGCYQAPAPPHSTTVLPQAPTFLYDYAEARRVAREEERPLLVLFTCRDCPCCRYMLEHALCDPLAAGPMADYVCVHVELEQNPQLCQQFRVRSFPTLQFLTSEGVAVRRVVGQMGGSEVAELLRETGPLAWQGSIRAARRTPYTYEDIRTSVR